MFACGGAAVPAGWAAHAPFWRDTIGRALEDEEDSRQTRRALDTGEKGRDHNGIEAVVEEATELFGVDVLAVRFQCSCYGWSVDRGRARLTTIVLRWVALSCSRDGLSLERLP